MLVVSAALRDAPLPTLANPWIYSNTLSLEQRGVIAHWDEAEAMGADSSKRLTEAELAAEYWRKDGDVIVALEGTSPDEYEGDLPNEAAVEFLRLLALERFATNPHYDE